jgi:hypothetical protein
MGTGSIQHPTNPVSQCSICVRSITSQIKKVLEINLVKGKILLTILNGADTIL